MTGVVRRVCCCKDRGTDGGDGGCDPSKFPSTAILAGTYDLTCRAMPGYSSFGEIGIVAPGRFQMVGIHTGQGFYEGSMRQSFVFVKHPFLSNPPLTVTGTLFAYASINSCGSGRFKFIPDPGSWIYASDLLEAEFWNLNSRCGSCGMQNGRGLEWTPESFWRYPPGSFAGSQCCGQYIPGPPFICLCKYSFFCNPGDQCDPCVAYGLYSATFSIS